MHKVLMALLVLGCLMGTRPALATSRAWHADAGIDATGQPVAAINGQAIGFDWDGNPLNDGKPLPDAFDPELQVPESREQLLGELSIDPTSQCWAYVTPIEPSHEKERLLAVSRFGDDSYIAEIYEYPSLTQIARLDLMKELGNTPGIEYHGSNQVSVDALARNSRGELVLLVNFDLNTIIAFWDGTELTATPCDPLFSSFTSWGEVSQTEPVRSFARIHCGPDDELMVCDSGLGYFHFFRRDPLSRHYERMKSYTSNDLAEMLDLKFPSDPFDARNGSNSHGQFQEWGPPGFEWVFFALLFGVPTALFIGIIWAIRVQFKRGIKW